MLTVAILTACFVPNANLALWTLLPSRCARVRSASLTIHRAITRRTLARIRYAKILKKSIVLDVLFTNNAKCLAITEHVLQGKHGPMRCYAPDFVDLWRAASAMFPSRIYCVAKCGLQPGKFIESTTDVLQFGDEIPPYACVACTMGRRRAGMPSIRMHRKGPDVLLEAFAVCSVCVNVPTFNLVRPLAHSSVPRVTHKKDVEHSWVISAHSHALRPQSFTMIRVIVISVPTRIMFVHCAYHRCNDSTKKR